MRRRSFLALTGSVALGALLDGSRTGFAASPHPDGMAKSQAIADRAAAFLNMLSGDQKAAVQFPFTPRPKATAALFASKMPGFSFVGEQYGQAMWSNFPVSDVPRPGLRMGSLNEGQRAAAMDLLRELLSDSGYRKAQDIMGSDQALADTGTPYASGRAAYTLAIFGTPGIEDVWMVQFGGHHLALNITMKGEQGVLAPVLTGALPAIYETNGTTVRTLASENDKAFALLSTFDEGQRKQGIIDHPVTELVQGPGHDGEALQPQGLQASAMTAEQRELLFDLALEWVGIVNDTYAAPRIAEIRAGLDETFFAWSGPLTHGAGRNGASYFRIHGPQLFIEFAPQEPGGDLTMHVHTIYRDPGNAYGRAFA